MLSRNEQINQLLEMFPDTTRENIATCLSVHGTVARAAFLLSMSTKGNDYRPASLPSILEELKGHMSNEKEKVKVDEEDLRMMLWHTTKILILIQRKSSESSTTSSLLQILVELLDRSSHSYST